ncbi:phosphotransferase enzyme family protein [Penicillium malachiteum]|uniref:Phosphotransferase enzyme family protein n=1 Tax=Penicillium malachiteum TaxID=1324776 RepID=A0AAD6HNG6_9EURO|nr:phosphotransferase enzyme family protein [Penicillium malachiteum]
MDPSELLEDLHRVEGQIWFDKMREVYNAGRICPWVSTFHPDRLSCEIKGKPLHGSFNWALKVVFSDGTAWLVRFPRGGHISKDIMDEKVTMEVSTLRLLRSQTTIPVPTVRAWGLAADNTLGVGPFIMMDFIEGKSLLDLLLDPDVENPTRHMRQDISLDKVTRIYRQMANFMLQMYHINFDKIGSLPWPETEATGLPRPLTFKAHEMRHTAGVDVFGDRTKGFASADEYIKHLVNENWTLITNQANGIQHRDHARMLYGAWQVIRQVVETGDFINKNYNTSQFKLICDDLGLANLIVRSEEDLTVVGVIDLEWSYVGPAQMAGSAPYWLLQDRPTSMDWDCVDGRRSAAGNRYFRHLRLYLRILEEEEAKVPEYKHELSDMIKWSQETGAMWLHMLVSNAFGGTSTFPFTEFRQHLGGEPQWVRREQEFKGPVMESFAARKELELRGYWEAVRVMKRGWRSSGTRSLLLRSSWIGGLRCFGREGMLSQAKE